MLNDRFPRPVLERTTAFSAFRAETTELDASRIEIAAHCRHDEREAVQWLLRQAQADAHSPDANSGSGSGSSSGPDPEAGGFFEDSARSEIERLARRLVETVRGRRMQASGVDALMREFSLSSDEGIALMCLAEALLRIPDRATADRLIADKIGRGDWRRHLGESPSPFVNAAAWGLLITGKLVSSHSEHRLGSAVSALIVKGGEPLIRKGVDLAMCLLGRQFIAGETIKQALDNGRRGEARGYRYSYDMLGEAALTEDDALRYLAAYEAALHAIGQASGGRGIRNGPGMSIKLSALHPRYARAQRARVMSELLPRLRQLALLARHYDIGLNIDAEEADRLALSLDLVDALAFDPALAGFDGIGVVVQAYQKRCPFVIDHLVDLARRSGRRFMIRLVKGAYWDAEIKRAQVDGLPGYPVYTRKAYTDVSYLVCARKLLQASGLIYPQFATHNAHTLAWVHAWARRLGIRDYEFQCLHGMGETLYDQVVGREGQAGLDVPCRIYAPVGSHRTLLAYLVRRLLENGANSSFVNRLVDEAVPVDSLVADPFDAARALDGAPHPDIPLPDDLFLPGRRNSSGLDLADDTVLLHLSDALKQACLRLPPAGPLVGQPAPGGEASRSGTDGMRAVRNPADRTDVVGHAADASSDYVERALAAALAHAAAWQATEPSERAARLECAADLFEARRHELMALAVREAGKSIPNAVAEVREAVDFLRYYGSEIRAAQAHGLPHPPAWGPVACISPWNFPLAIFTGQIAAALAAGNAVLAKPAEQTPLIACLATRLMHEAGIPKTALQLLPGPGDTVGAALVADMRTRGVIFTGSTEVARAINRVLTRRSIDERCELPFIAETGGQNAMIVDSSALPEQVVQDAVASAFDSAGQRCSALRVLCLQEEIADRVLDMLRGAMRELRIGNPDRLATDVGPVIDRDAQHALQAHIEAMKPHAKSWMQLPLPQDCEPGTFVAPALIEISSLSKLTHEVFGPVLHVLRYRRSELPQLVEAINLTGYGLTLGIHSRIDETIDAVVSRARVGNIYVNRSMVGAVVGVQPFGGEGLSGTGPKAGGPLYLWRLQRRLAGWLNAPAGKIEKMHELVGVRAGGATAKALDGLQEWAQAQGRSGLLSLTGRYREETLCGKNLVLPGPTGERNSLTFLPKGKIWCEADTGDRSADALLNQIAAALACGNGIVMPQRAVSQLPPDLPDSLLNLIELMPNDATAEAPIQLALAAGGAVDILRDVLADRAGAIVPVIETVPDEPISLWRLVAERAVSVNTAAVGGNASLMTLRG